MKNLEFVDVVQWYEKQLGRKLNEAERASIRYQYAASNNRIPKTSDLNKFGIFLCGIEHAENADG